MTQRTRRTPAERAQAALDTAERKVTRLKAKGDRLASELQQVGEDMRAAEDRRAYLAGDPALTGSDDL